jgi:hypothetical protein
MRYHACGLIHDKKKVVFIYDVEWDFFRKDFGRFGLGKFYVHDIAGRHGIADLD